MNYPFERLPNAHAICFALNDIPEHWSLTPIWDKSPKRDDWQTEDKLDIGLIAELIFDGEPKISKKTNKPYKMFASGYGLRTGDYSGGLLAIDVDGATAIPILEKLSGHSSKELQTSTVSWTSGKPGRFQLLFQIPEDWRHQLVDFTRAVVHEHDGLKCAQDEEGKWVDGLEFRYNKMQSCLPPSRHPQTGAYKWITPPTEKEVLMAPVWLLNLLLELKSKEITTTAKPVDWTRYKKEVSRGLGASTDLADFLYNDIYPRLSPEQIFSWSGHNFKQYGKTLKGNPPWRQSASGTSFHVWWDGKEWAWQDKQTGEGGGAVNYRHKLNNGTGKPRGKDFVEILKQLAQEAGVTMPTYTLSTIVIAEKKVAKQEAQIEIAKANADLLTETIALSEPKYSNKEKADMIRTLTELWAPDFKTTVWANLEAPVKIQIRVLLTAKSNTLTK